MCALYIYAYIYVNTYRHISNNMISWCVQTWNSPKYSDFDEKNISFQTKIQGFFPTAESMADVVYSSNIYQISLSSLVPCFFLHLYGIYMIDADLYWFTWILLLKISFYSVWSTHMFLRRTPPRPYFMDLVNIVEQQDRLQHLNMTTSGHSALEWYGWRSKT